MLKAALKRRRVPLIVAGLVVAYAVFLVLWTRGSDPHTPAIADPAGSTQPSGTLPSGSPSDASPSPSSTKSRVGTSGPLVLPPLPQSTDINGANAPRHSVILTVVSDSAILRYGYAVKGGSPAQSKGTNARSPLQVTTIAHGYGAMAVIGAQASPYATYITCTVVVDGSVRTTHTVHGGWGVAVCLG